MRAVNTSGLEIVPTVVDAGRSIKEAFTTRGKPISLFYECIVGA
jgi:hypothetical protein